MKTLEQIYDYKGGSNTGFLDKRDFRRLLEFMPAADWPKLGFRLDNEEALKTFQPMPLTYENVVEQLKRDLAFAFDKALGQRGISSSLMWDVIKMWMWVLDDELADFSDENYAQYGLPLYKAVAVKYQLPNQIGGDEGNEEKYASD